MRPLPTSPTQTQQQTASRRSGNATSITTLLKPRLCSAKLARLQKLGRCIQAALQGTETLVNNLDPDNVAVDGLVEIEDELQKGLQDIKAGANHYVLLWKYPERYQAIEAYHSHLELEEQAGPACMLQTNIDLEYQITLSDLKGLKKDVKQGGPGRTTYAGATLPSVAAAATTLPKPRRVAITAEPTAEAEEAAAQQLPTVQLTRSALGAQEDQRRLQSPGLPPHKRAFEHGGARGRLRAQGPRGYHRVPNPQPLRLWKPWYNQGSRQRRARARNHARIRER